LFGAPTLRLNVLGRLSPPIADSRPTDAIRTVRRRIGVKIKRVVWLAGDTDPKSATSMNRLCFLFQQTHKV
jgi:hypothetical protein